MGPVHECSNNVRSSSESVILQNNFFQIGGSDSDITVLKIDPSGSGNFDCSIDILGGKITLYLWRHKANDPVGQYFIGKGLEIAIIDSNTLTCTVDFPDLVVDGDQHLTSTLTISINDSILSADMDLNFASDNLDVYMSGIIIQMPFERAGYDTSINKTVFSSFFTNTFDYVPIEQFKRRSFLAASLKSWYDWLLASGVEGLGYDLNFTSFERRIEFYIEDERLGLCFPGTGIINLTENKHYSRRVEFKVQSPGPKIPQQYPFFYTSNETFDDLLNSLFLERVFSWPPSGGQADWLEWQNTIVDWIDSPYLKLMRDQLKNIKLTADGYVYTWGDKLGWPFPDNEIYDTRHFTTNPSYILGLYRYFCWTKDDTFLDDMYPQLHDATTYLVRNISAWNGIFVITAKDHYGLGRVFNLTSNQYEFRSVGSNYWDILPFGYKSACCNAYIHGALKAMADIERYRNNDTGAQYLDEIAIKLRKKYNEYFWNNYRGRYIGCIDINGDYHDHGFVFLNLEAIYYGLANFTQVMRIYDWLHNEPTCTGLKDVYSRWQFAPRATTDWNENWWFAKVAENFGEQVQDGGAILYTSGYDIRDRGYYLGSDDALARMEGILGRYALPDKLCGGNPRYTGEDAQQENPGAVGTDGPFPESGLAPVSFIEGILGVRVNATHLIIEPELPLKLDYMGIHGLQVANMKIDINITRDNIKISYIAGSLSKDFHVVVNGNQTCLASDIYSNKTVTFQCDGLRFIADKIMKEATRVKNFAKASGAIFDCRGTNKSSYLESLLSNCSTQYNAGNYHQAIILSRQLINETSFLMNASSLDELQGVLTNFETIQQRWRNEFFWSSQASIRRDKALEELDWAMASLSRGNGWWFLEHFSRAGMYME
ncbi:MAG: hypothetical protein ACTSRA_14165, partial [Promethearchaeota archaeon]